MLATGVSYRRLGVPELEELSGTGVFYGAIVTEAHALAGERRYVVGGGNSAGQAALHLARYAARSRSLVRGESLARDHVAATCVDDDRRDAEHRGAARDRGRRRRRATGGSSS